MDVELFSKPFLRSYLIAEELDDADDITVQLMLDAHHGFQLEIALDIASVDLMLVHPAFHEPVQLGWSDLAHWHSHVLRVEEVDRLIAGITVTPQTPHSQAVARVLLSLFTLPESSNVTRHQATMRDALHTLGFSDIEITVVQGNVFHPQVFGALDDARWSNTDERWFAVDDGAYSLRNPENPDFPHAELMEVLARATR